MRLFALIWVNRARQQPDLSAPWLDVDHPGTGLIHIKVLDPFAIHPSLCGQCGGVVMSSSLASKKLPVLVAAVVCLSPPVAMQPASAQSPRLLEIVSVCAPRHGKDSRSGTAEVPNLAGQRSIYLREQLIAFRTGRRKHPDMKSIARYLTDRDIDESVAYYSTLP
jgi:cytochrome c553